MKVGEQGIHNAETKSRGDEQMRFGPPEFNKIVRSCFSSTDSCVFQGAYRGSAYSQDAAPCVFCAGDSFGSVWGDLIRFAMHYVSFECFAANRLKGAQADMKGDLTNFNATGANVFKNLRSEMQTGRRSRDGARLAGEDRPGPL